MSGTPSQLISRLTPPNEPFAPATMPPPIAVRKSSRIDVIPAAVVAVPENRMGAAWTDGEASNVARPASTNIVFIERPPLSKFEWRVNILGCVSTINHLTPRTIQLLGTKRSKTFSHHKVNLE